MSLYNGNEWANSVVDTSCSSSIVSFFFAFEARKGANLPSSFFRVRTHRNRFLGCDQKSTRNTENSE